MECIRLPNEKNTKRAIGLLNDHKARDKLGFLDPCKNYMSPLLYALNNARHQEDYQLLHVLLDSNQRASVNFTDQNWLTPLMVAAWYGNVEVCRRLIHKKADVNALVENRVFRSALAAAMYNHLKVNEVVKTDRYAKTVALLIQHGVQLKLGAFYRSNFVRSIIPLLDIISNNHNSLTVTNCRWELLMDVVLRTPASCNNGITNEHLEDTAIGLMIRRGLTQKPLSTGHFFQKESVFHLATCKGFQKLLEFLIHRYKAYRTEGWIVNNNLSSDAKPSDDIVAQVRRWRRGSPVTNFTNLQFDLSF